MYHSLHAITLIYQKKKEFHNTYSNYFNKKLKQGQKPYLKDRKIHECNSFRSIFLSLLRSIFKSSISKRLLASLGGNWSYSSASFTLPANDNLDKFTFRNGENYKIHL